MLNIERNQSEAKQTKVENIFIEIDCSSCLAMKPRCKFISSELRFLLFFRPPWIETLKAKISFIYLNLFQGILINSHRSGNFFFLPSPWIQSQSRTFVKMNFSLRRQCQQHPMKWCTPDTRTNGQQKGSELRFCAAYAFFSVRKIYTKFATCNCQWEKYITNKFNKTFNYK